jgi:hypothetical protein
MKRVARTDQKVAQRSHEPLALEVHRRPIRKSRLRRQSNSLQILFGEAYWLKAILKNVLVVICGLAAAMVLAVAAAAALGAVSFLWSVA